jgi:hypothetical protein
MMTGFIVEIVIIPFYIGLIPFEPRFCPKSKSEVQGFLASVRASVGRNWKEALEQKRSVFQGVDR